MDEIERRIRLARPVSGNRNLPLTDRAKRELAELLIAQSEISPASILAAGTPHTPGVSGVPGLADAGPQRRTPRLRRWFGLRSWTLLAAACVLAVVIGVAWSGHSAPAVAATPRLLQVVDVPQDAASILADLARAARERPAAPAEDEVRIAVQTWTLDVELVDGELDESATIIAPVQYEITIRADGSQSMVATAGVAVDSDGIPVRSDPSPGTLLWELDLGPGEYEPFFATPAPTRSEELGAYLSAGSGLDTDASASNAFLAVGYLLLEQELDGEQSAALVEYLADLPDVTLAGATTDRLDRPAIALSAPRVGEPYVDYLLLDPTTGEVLATEAVYVGTDRTDIAAPAVTEYYAWEKD